MPEIPSETGKTSIAALQNRGQTGTLAATPGILDTSKSLFLIPNESDGSGAIKVSTLGTR
jgi:hypothetical protein